MSKTTEFTIKERLAVVGILNAGKFNNVTLSSVLADIPNIVMTDEEWAVANLTKTPSDEEVKAITAEDPTKSVDQQWKWDEVNKTIELQTGTVDAIKAIIKEKSDANELTLADAALIGLQAKLEAE